MAKDITEKDVEEWFRKKFSEEWGKGCKKSKKETVYKNAGAGGLYCVGFIGAAVYYIQTATSFWDGVLGFLKACVWPAFLVHGLLKYLGL
ncbi:MAG: hypothetical protein WC752_02590 [Patescibacteria group bacterium]|jgi:hypothetical protein